MLRVIALLSVVPACVTRSQGGVVCSITDHRSLPSSVSRLHASMHPCNPCIHPIPYTSVFGLPSFFKICIICFICVPINQSPLGSPNPPKGGTANAHNKYISANHLNLSNQRFTSLPDCVIQAGVFRLPSSPA